jgi:tight adherence protein B
MTATPVLLAAIAVTSACVVWRSGVDLVVARRVRRRLPRTSRDATVPRDRLGALVSQVRRRRDGDAIDRGLPAWLDASARSARAGASLREALCDGASVLDGSATQQFLHPLVGSVQRGDPLDRALGHLADAPPGSARVLVARALRLAASVVGPAAAVLEEAASTLHERAALVREVRALSTQARVSAALMAVAPVVFALCSVQLDPRVGAFFATVPGIGCVIAGLALNGAGAWWMARIVRAAT